MGVTERYNKKFDGGAENPDFCEESLRLYTKLNQKYVFSHKHGLYNLYTVNEDKHIGFKVEVRRETRKKPKDLMTDSTPTYTTGIIEMNVWGRGQLPKNLSAMIDDFEYWCVSPIDCKEPTDDQPE